MKFSIKHIPPLEIPPIETQQEALQFINKMIVNAYMLAQFYPGKMRKEFDKKTAQLRKIEELIKLQSEQLDSLTTQVDGLAYANYLLRDGWAKAKSSGFTNQDAMGIALANGATQAEAKATENAAKAALLDSLIASWHHSPFDWALNERGYYRYCNPGDHKTKLAKYTDTIKEKSDAAGYTGA